jgi:hypothetical protein
LSFRPLTRVKIFAANSLVMGRVGFISVLHRVATVEPDALTLARQAKSHDKREQ